MTETKELLKDYLLEGADKALEQQTDTKKKAAEKKKAEQKKAIEEATKVAVAKSKKSQYEQVFDKTAEELSNRMVDEWNAENTARKEIKDDADKLASAVKSAKDGLAKAKTDLISKISDSINNYIACCATVNPQDVQTFDGVRMMIYTKAELQFTDLKAKAQAANAAMAKLKAKLAKAASVKLDLEFGAEHISQKIAEVPLKIEDKIQEVKDMLDKLLGKFLVKTMNPDMPEFDIDALIGKIMAVLTPLMSVISPLEAVGGKVPVLSDLIAILSMMSTQAADKKVPKDALKKLVPNFPELPPNLLDKAKGVMDDVLAVAMQLPMLLINVILEMINVIYSKLKIITSVIPLGSFFPLTLIDSAITSVPTIVKFMYQAPSLIFVAVKGLIKQKLAEALALSIPSPHLDMALLTSIIPEVDDSAAEKPSTKFKPDAKKIDYSDVNTIKYNVVKDFGYDRTDLARILKNYLAIYDGSGASITKYVQNGGKVEPSQITRHKPSPEDYQNNGCKLPSNAELKDSGIPFDEINKVESVVGGEYWLYEDYIKSKEPGPSVVTRETITP